MSDEKPSRRRVLRRAGAIGAAAIGVGATDTGGAQRGNSAPGEAVRSDRIPELFGGDADSCDVERTSDDRLPFDTEGDYGGWGGHAYHETDEGSDEPPVVFVHGNTDDACAFDPHADAFLDGEFSGDDLWAITFREETTTHSEMVDQLEGFVTQVLDEVGGERVSIVAHSLGVTGARLWMDEADRIDDVETFVGLAGANHGTWVCGPGCRALPGPGEPCQFISPACAEPDGPLYDLNTPDETPGDVDYYTIRGGRDGFFLHDRESPALDGGENVDLEGTDHDGVRENEASIRLVAEWLR